MVEGRPAQEHEVALSQVLIGVARLRPDLHALQYAESRVALEGRFPGRAFAGLDFVLDPCVGLFRLFDGRIIRQNDAKQLVLVFRGDRETLRFKHSVKSRDLFAYGLVALGLLISLVTVFLLSFIQEGFILNSESCGISADSSARRLFVFLVNRLIFLFLECSPLLGVFFMACPGYHSPVGIEQAPHLGLELLEIVDLVVVLRVLLRLFGALDVERVAGYFRLEVHARRILSERGAEVPAVRLVDVIDGAVARHLHRIRPDIHELASRDRQKHV